MKRLFRYTLASISLLFLFTWQSSETRSCAEWAQPEDTRFCFFNPAVSSPASAAPLWYSANSYGSTGYAERDPDQLQNIQEWQNYLGGNVSTGAIDTLLYSTEADKLVETMENCPDGKCNDPISRNAMFRALLQPSRKKALHYFLLAKKIEYYTFSSDPWSEWNDGPFYSADAESMAGYWETTGEMLKTNPDSFLYLRYAYQKVILERKFGYWENCIHSYDSLVAPVKTNSILKVWALSAKAASLYNIGEKTASSYTFVQVYDLSPGKKTYAASNFCPSQTQNVLALCRNDHERALTLLLSEMRNPGRCLKTIRRIAALEPQLSDLNLLLVREINKLEDWLITSRSMGSPSVYPGREYYDRWSETKWPRQKDEHYLGELADFVFTANASGKVPDKALWHTAAAYLAYLADNKTGAEAALGNAFAAGTKNPEISKQMHELRVLLKLENVNRLSVFEQRQLALDLDTAAKEINFRNYKSHNALLILLAEQFQKKGDITRSALFFAGCVHATRYNSNGWWMDEDMDGETSRYFRYNNLINYLDEEAGAADMQKLISLMDEKNKNPLDSFLTVNADTFKTDLLNLAGMIYMRDNRPADAYAYFRRISGKDTIGAVWAKKAWENVLDANPLFVGYNEPHRKQAADTITFTKAALCKKIIELKQQAVNGDAKAALLLGNIYYSISWHGNSWMMTQYRSSCYEMEYPDDLRRNEHRIGYYSCSQAARWYEAALRMSADKELQAECNFRLGLCFNNKRSFSNTLAGKKPKRKSANPYFLRLYDGFSETDFYSGITMECLTLTDYIARYRNI